MNQTKQQNLWIKYTISLLSFVILFSGCGKQGKNNEVPQINSLPSVVGEQPSTPPNLTTEPITIVQEPIASTPQDQVTSPESILNQTPSVFLTPGQTQSIEVGLINPETQTTENSIVVEIDSTLTNSSVEDNSTSTNQNTVVDDDNQETSDNVEDENQEIADNVDDDNQETSDKSEIHVTGHCNGKRQIIFHWKDFSNKNKISKKFATCTNNRFEVTLHGSHQNLRRVTAYVEFSD